MSMLKAIAISLTLSAAAIAQTTLPAAPATRPTKQLYCDVGYHLPTWRARLIPGFLPAVVEHGGRFLASNGREDSYFVGGYDGPGDQIIPSKLRAAVVGLPPGTLYVYDQERPSWSTDPDAVAPDVAAANRQRYLDFAKIIRDANPLVRVGFYDVYPRRNYWVPMKRFKAARLFERWKAGETLTDHERWEISHAYRWDGAAWVPDDTIGGPEGSVAYLKWKQGNEQVAFGTDADGTIDPRAGIANAVDAVTPSLYDFYEGDDTEAYVAEMVAEARRLSAGRPVYPFIWPAYHNSNAKVGGQPIPLDEWRAHVRYVLKAADGCVLWGADPVRHREHIRVLMEEAEIASRAASSEAK